MLHLRPGPELQDFACICRPACIEQDERQLRGERGEGRGAALNTDVRNVQQIQLFANAFLADDVGLLA
jgi:hypothetical protein